MKVSPKELADIEAFENDETIEVDGFKENIQNLLTTRKPIVADKGDKLVYHPKAFK